MQKLLIKLDHPDCKPAIGSADSAGLDLRVFLGNNPRRDALQIEPGQKVLVGTGVKMAIPQGWVGLVIPRSSVGTKLDISLANTIGVIDADYRGEIKLCLRNNGTEPQVFFNFDRICQIVIVPYFPGSLAEYVDDLDETVRGEGGFGHSGTN